MEISSSAIYKTIGFTDAGELSQTISISAKNFNPPVDFKPKEIKFAIDGKLMNYNLAEYKWE